MAPTAPQTTKPVFKTSTPFTETKWPNVSPGDQQIIVDLVCNIIAPLGEYRKTHIEPSKGKRIRKRKRIEERKKAATTTPPDQSSEESRAQPPPIQRHILVGINSITRHLEGLVSRNAPNSTPVANAVRDEEMGDVNDPERSFARPLSMIFIPHPNPSLSPAHAHLPTLIHLSSLSPSTNTSSSRPEPQLRPTLLIPLPTHTSSTFSNALHIPRVSALALMADTPGLKALEDFVREKVGPTECAWVDEAVKGVWRGVSIKS